ncbi:lasso RiPP family leader peptide-containing protein [Streptomyces sp. AV19]|nr:lasso RiPP family leader peptide-containing protein [Streptomyces sp. AV19]MBH1937427.1 lasso RiPP family leader peptide-containing protein [Streptomyces sp. AV19]MDG4533800.1 lasso RiPP family leader peptide-containing protein [Streptomyces sp. AV19]
MERQDIYEPPALAEIGDFTELTRGFINGQLFDSMGYYYFGTQG